MALLNPLMIFRSSCRRSSGMTSGLPSSSRIAIVQVGRLDYLLTETIRPGERINLQRTAFTDKRWITHFVSQSDTVTNVNQYVGHFILLSHREEFQCQPTIVGRIGDTGNRKISRL